MNLNNAQRVQQGWLSKLSPLYFPGIKDHVVFLYSNSELGLEGQDNAVNLVLLWRQQPAGGFWNILGWFFSLGHGKNWWVCLVMVCPCWLSVPCKTGRTKTAMGHLYYAVFSVIYHCAVSFFLFKLFLSSVGFISTEYCYSIVLKKQVPFLSDNLLYGHKLPLKSWRAKDEQTNARSSLKSFYFESAKNHKYYLVAEESTTALRRQQIRLKLENKWRVWDTWTCFIVVIF